MVGRAQPTSYMGSYLVQTVGLILLMANAMSANVTELKSGRHKKGKHKKDRALLDSGSTGESGSMCVSKNQVCNPKKMCFPTTRCKHWTKEARKVAPRRKAVGVVTAEELVDTAAMSKHCPTFGYTIGVGGKGSLERTHIKTMTRKHTDKVARIVADIIGLDEEPKLLHSLEPAAGQSQTPPHPTPPHPIPSHPISSRPIPY